MNPSRLVGRLSPIYGASMAELEVLRPDLADDIRDFVGALRQECRERRLDQAQLRAQLDVHSHAPARGRDNT